MKISVFKKQNFEGDIIGITRVIVKEHHPTPTVCTAVSTLMQSIGLELMDYGLDAFSRSHDFKSNSNDVNMMINCPEDHECQMLMKFLVNSLSHIRSQFGAIHLEIITYRDETNIH